MSELLPCPFCGGEADTDRTMERFEYCTGGPNSVKDYGYYVYCTKCNASMGLINVPPSSPEEAAKEWNCRAVVGLPVEVHPPQQVREAVIMQMDGEVDADALRFVVYNDTSKGEWLAARE